MKTTIEQQCRIRGLKCIVSLDGIAAISNILPLSSVNNNGSRNNTTETIFCESISGGADEVNNMPRELTLTKLKYINGELHKFEAIYKIVQEQELPHFVMLNGKIITYKSFLNKTVTPAIDEIIYLDISLNPIEWEPKNATQGK